VVAADESALDAAVADFSGQLVLFLSILAAALLLAAWLQVSLGLRPLRTLQDSLKAVREGRAQRLQGAYPSEVEPLAQGFNRVLDQNEQVVARARQLAGNLAHAIKTPLAVIANLADDERMERTVLARQLREQVGQVRQQVDWHLHRARSGRAGLPGLQAAVQPVIEGLARVMRKVHAHESGPELGLEVLPIAPALYFAGEEQDLQEMVGNLLDNACKWARSRVRVQATAKQGTLVIVIDDDGPGLSAAQRQRVFERGVRADERQPGSGLGLAIVRETAGLYQGSVALQPSELGGLRAELRLGAVIEP
jgi:signal transduction histidine kinase